MSNYSAKETERIHAALAERGVPLATNQVEYSLLRRRPETGGLLATCRQLGVVLLAYSPIGQGRLTGKYSAANPPPGKRNFSAHPMEEVDQVVAVLRRIGSAHDRTPSQVALRWLIDKGAVPDPGRQERRAGRPERRRARLVADRRRGRRARRASPSTASAASRTASGSTAEETPTVPACDHLQFWRHLPAETAKGTR